MPFDPHAVRFQAVASPYPYDWRPPWPDAEPDPRGWLVLSGEMAPGAIGRLVATLVVCNDVAAEGTPEDVLRRLAEAEGLTLPGGVLVRDGSGSEVGPGCCCGLEDWREWLSVADGAGSPWMGHDPWGWVEHEPDAVRICSGPADYERRAHGQPTAVVRVARAELPRLLDGLRAGLEGCLARLREWAAAIDPEVGARLAERFDREFVRLDSPAPAEG